MKTFPKQNFIEMSLEHFKKIMRSQGFNPRSEPADKKRTVTITTPDADTVKEWKRIIGQ